MGSCYLAFIVKMKANVCKAPSIVPATQPMPNTCVELHEFNVELLRGIEGSGVHRWGVVVSKATRKGFRDNVFQRFWKY